MASLKKIIDIVSDYNYEEFTSDQIALFSEGIQKKLPVRQFLDPNFTPGQLEEIIKGLEKKLDVSWYAKVDFHAFAMRQIRYGLEQGLDVSIYAKLEYDPWRMELIFEAIWKNYPLEYYLRQDIKNDKLAMITRFYENRYNLDAIDVMNVDLGYLEDQFIMCKRVAN